MVYLAGILQRVADGEFKHVIINLPPQHGKSSIVTRFVAYMLECDPTIRAMLGAYSVDLVQDFSVTIRDITRSRGKTVVRRDTDAKGHWKTSKGGQVHAVSVGGAATGNPSDLTVIDDPYKDFVDACSPATQKNVLTTWRTAWMNRLSKRGIVIITHTRWLENDLSGYLLDEGGWLHINLPAIAEENDPLGRQPGEALCPDLHPLEQLMWMKKGYQSHEWNAIFQGNPIPSTGGMFKVDNIKYFDELPYTTINGKQVPLELKTLRSWDRAGTEGAGDYTTGPQLAIDTEGRIYCLDLVRGQWSDLQVDQEIDKAAARDGRGSRHTFQQDPGSAGKSDTARAVRRLNKAGYVATSAPATGSKVIRSRVLAAAIENGDFYVPRDAPWVKALIDEMRSAPYGKNDDIWDAIGWGVNDLTNPQSYEGVAGYYAKKAALVRAKQQRQKDGRNCTCDLCKSADILIEEAKQTTPI